MFQCFCLNGERRIITFADFFRKLLNFLKLRKVKCRQRVPIDFCNLKNKKSNNVPINFVKSTKFRRIYEFLKYFDNIRVRKFT